MKRICLILSVVAMAVLARGATVVLQWEPPESKTNLNGYVVKIATNNEPWVAAVKVMTNAITLTDMMPGTWRLGIAALRDAQTNMPWEVDWSLRFTIEPAALPAPIPTNAPPPMPSTNGLALWLIAEGLNPLVSYWPDRSGNERDAVQTKASWQPKLQGNRVHFDGIDDFMTFNLPVNGLTVMTMVVVSANSVPQMPGETQAERAALFWGETFNWGCVYLSPWQAGVGLRFGTKQVGNRILFKPMFSVGNKLTRTVAVHDKGIDYLYVNGGLVVRQTGKLPTISACRDVGNLGRGFDDNTFFAGDIAEVLVYTRALDDVELYRLDNYLAEKYP